jgi:hypothetical protein
MKEGVPGLMPIALRPDVRNLNVKREFFSSACCLPDDETTDPCQIDNYHQNASHPCEITHFVILLPPPPGVLCAK